MAEGILELNEENFDTEVGKSDVPVLVDFWAPWCGPCLMIAPILIELAKEYAGKAKVGKVNVDNNLTLAQKFSIHSIPTLIFFKKGTEINRLIGAVSKDTLKKTLDTVK